MQSEVGSVSEKHWYFSEVLLVKGALIKAVFLNILMQIIQIITALFSMVVYNRFSLITPCPFILWLWRIYRHLFDFAQVLKARLVNDAGDAIDLALQRRLFSKVLSWDLETRPKLAGSSASLSRDLENLTDLFANASLTTAIGVPFILFNCTVIYLIAGPLVLVTGSIALLAFLVSVFFYVKVNNISAAAKQTNLDRLSVFVEALNNLETLKSIASYSYFEDRFRSSDDTQRVYANSLKNITVDANNFNAFLSSLAQISVISFGAFLVIRGDITSGALIGTVILSGKTLQPCFQLANLLQRLSIAKVSYQRLNKVFSYSSEEEKRRKNIKLQTLSGDIRIEGLAFQPQGLTKPIFECKRLKIKEYEKIGIVGSVGSGKSTFLKLISGILTPTNGSVSFGAFNTTAINQADFRRDLAYSAATRNF